MLIHVKSPVRIQTNSKYHTLVEKLIKHVIYTTTYKPKQILLIGFGIVVVIGFGITKVKMDSYLFDDLSPKSQIMKDLTFFEKEVTGIASIEIH
jgi:predicted RND superfamily exporter protein